MKCDILYENERLDMVERQIKSRGIRDERLLDVLRSIPRHVFVPEEQQIDAYTDRPLPIGFGQTISQPYMTAYMTWILRLKGDEKVLEIGSGSGYQAAILSQLASVVYSVERIPELAARAEKTIRSLEINNVHFHVGDGSLGLEGFAPYSCIVVTAAAPSAPQPLIDQLAMGGMLVAPVGSREMQELEIWKRNAAGLTCEKQMLVTFVPLRGKYGWPESSF